MEVYGSIQASVNTVINKCDHKLLMVLFSFQVEAIVKWSLCLVCVPHRPPSPATRCPPGWRWSRVHRAPDTRAPSLTRRRPCSPLLSACGPWSARRRTRCRCCPRRRGGGAAEERASRPGTPSATETREEKLKVDVFIHRGSRAFDSWRN